MSLDQYPVVVLYRTLLVFTSLHGMQTRSCDEISVRLSVCLSVKRVHCDKTEKSYVYIFYRAAWNATRSYDEISVCLSVCPSVRPSVRPSVCQTCVLWQNGRKICPDFYTMRKIILSSFMRRRMVGAGRPILSEILGQPARVGAKSPILNQ